MTDERSPVSWRVRMVGQTGSTSDDVRREAEQGADEGLVIVADQQTAGRGRRERRWESPPGLGLYVSFLLRPPWSPDWAAWAGVLGGIATARACSVLGVSDLSIKWPNDIMIGPRKLAGVLTEPRTGTDRIDFIVIGIGLNMQQQPHDFPESIRDRATSLVMAGVHADPETVLVSLVNEMDRTYAEASLDPEALAASWQNWCGDIRVPNMNEESET